MLRAAAAGVAFVLLPLGGYLLSVYFATGHSSSSGSSSSSSSSTSASKTKKQMIYSSKSALPSEWDIRRWGRSTPAQQYLKVDGLTVKYIGPGETDAQAASIFADKAVPQDLPLYYFEVYIVNRGDQGFIGIGFCTDDVNLGRLPGWEPHSYGYHGDDGHAFHGSGLGRAFGPRFTTGDVVGALLDRGQHTISFYKNGESVGTAFYSVKEDKLYPCVGMRTPNEEIRANFGATPFAVDMPALQAQFRERVLGSIAAVKLPAAVDLTAAPPSAAAAAAGSGAAGQSQKGLAAAPVAAAAAAGGTGGRGSGGGGGAAAAAAAEPESRLEPAALAILAAVKAARAADDADDDAAEEPAAGDAASRKDAPAATGSSSRSQPLLPYLIFDYLLHQRCWRTAAIVARDMLGGTSSSGGKASAAAAAAGPETAAPMEVGGGEEEATMAGAVAAAAAAAGPSSAPSSSAAATAAAAAGEADVAAGAGALSEADIQDALRRQRIFDAVAAGQLSEALSQVTRHYGSAVLDSNPQLVFKLKVQQFVELVRQASSSSSSKAAAAVNGGSSGSGGGSTSSFEAALAYGRAELGPGSKSAEDEELLSDALSLLAYAEPAASPCGHLLRPCQRVLLAEELNGALLKARGTSAQPLLEALYRQAVVLLDELKRQGVPAALVLDVPAMCLRGEAVQRQQQRQQQKKGHQAGSSAAAAGGCKAD